MTRAGVTRRIALFTAAALALLTAGCGGSDTTQQAGELPIIKWGFFRNYQPVYVGLEKGFFREEGVDLQLTGTFNSGPAVVQAAGLGRIDAGHSAVTGLAGAYAAGIKVVGVADSQTEFLDAPLQQWFVRNSSPVKSVADLRGKKIGTNALSGSFYYTMLIALEKAGLKKTDVQFVTLPHDKQEQALLAGQIDVAGVIDPYSVKLAKNPDVRRVLTGAEVLGERQFSLVFFSRTFVDQHPDTVQKFLTGYRRAVEFMKGNPEASSKIMAEKLGLAEGDVVPHKYTSDAVVRKEDVGFWIDVMRANGELSEAPALKAEDIVSTQTDG